MLRLFARARSFSGVVRYASATLFTHNLLPQERAAFEKYLPELDKKGVMQRYTIRLQVDKWDEAKQLAEKNLNNPNILERVDAFLVLAWYYARAKQYEKSVQYINDALLASKGNKEGHIHLMSNVVQGLCTYHLFTECLQLINTLLPALSDTHLASHLEQYTPSVKVLQKNGHVLEEESTFVNAKFSNEMFQAMEKCMPFDWRLSFIVAQALKSTNPQLALQYLNRSIQAAGPVKKVVPMFTLALWSGLSQQAINAYTEISNIDVPITGPFIARIVALSNASLVEFGKGTELNKTKAVDAAEQAVKLAPNDNQVKLSRGLVYSKVGRGKEALVDLKIGADSGDYSLTGVYANALQDAYEATKSKAYLTEAIALYNKMLATNAKDYLLHVQMAKAKELSGANKEEILVHVRKALELQPNNVSALLLSYSMETDPSYKEKTISELKKLRDQYPNSIMGQRLSKMNL
jgi:tetratricopeptide (TPR) repeat protein